MKKSELFHLAQIAVVNSPSISPEGKLEILEELISQEQLYKWAEKREQKEGSENAEE